MKTAGRWLIHGVVALTAAVFFSSGVVSGAGFGAEAFASEKTITGLGTGAIADPSKPDELTDPWSGSYVWYGKYEQDDGSDGKEPVKYRVLDKETARFNPENDRDRKTLFLDCDSVLFKKEFQGTGHEATWSESNLKIHLNDSFLKAEEYFSKPESDAIAESYIESHELTVGTEAGNVGQTIKDYFTEYVALNGDKIFPLDSEDVSNIDYGYMPSGEAVKCISRIKNLAPLSGQNRWEPGYWLRSKRHYDAGYVFIPENEGGTNRPGGIQYFKGHPDTNTEPYGCVSPAFNVNLKNIIFTSLVSGTAGELNAEYKLTLADEKMELLMGTVSRNGDSLTIPYTITGDNKDQANRVSILRTKEPFTAGKTITDPDEYQYSKLNTGEGEFKTEGSGSITLPEDYNNYHFYILAEDINGEKETDYASAPVEITIPSQPEIKKQPGSLEYSYGEGGKTLSLEAEGESGHKLNYQWYISATGSYDNGKKIEGATKTSFALPEDQDAGAYYYYCEVMDPLALPAVNSSISKVTIKKVVYKGEKTRTYYAKQEEAETGIVCELPSPPAGAEYKNNTSITGDTGLIVSHSLNGMSLIFSTVEKKTAPQSAIIKIPVVGANNYKDYNFELTITTKKDAVVSIKGGDITVTYGNDSFPLIGNYEESDKNGVWKYISEDPYIAEITENGQVIIKAAGETKIGAVYESDTFYGKSMITLTVEKADPVYVKHPEGKESLVYDGTMQELVSEGIAKGGEIRYAIGSPDSVPPDESFSSEIPAAREAGEYRVYYKIFGNDNYNASECISLKVTISDNKGSEEDDPEKDDPEKDDPEKDDPEKDDPKKDDPEKENTEKKITGLGTGAICDPDPPAEGNKGWSGSYVYYGKYDSNGNGALKSLKYRVLDKETNRFGGNTLFLDCDQTIYADYLFYENISGDAQSYDYQDWLESPGRKLINGEKFLEKEGCFRSSEKDAIAFSSVEAHDLIEGTGEGRVSAWTKENYRKFTALKDDRIFLLDAEDVSNPAYGYSNTEELSPDRQKNDCWWIRSTFYRPDTNGVLLYGLGSILDAGGISVGAGTEVGISPAFNVGLDHVIFTSLVSGEAGKAGAEYKLTLLNKDMKVVVKEGDGVQRSGNKVTVSYETIGGSDRVSLLFTDKPYEAGKAVTEGYKYLKLSEKVTGTADFDIPDEYKDKVWGEDYHVYILAEQVNGEKETDFASAPLELKIQSSADQSEKDNKDNAQSAEEKKNEALFLNLPSEEKIETVGDYQITYSHKIPFAGKAKLTLKSFGENFTVSYNGIPYKVSKIKVNKKLHRIQITGLEGADKKTVKEIKKATKGAGGIPYEHNPYYVGESDEVKTKIKKGSGDLSSVKIRINGKLYKAKKNEYDYDKETGTITFKGDNLAGSRKIL